MNYRFLDGALGSPLNVVELTIAGGIIYVLLRTCSGDTISQTFVSATSRLIRTQGALDDVCPLVDSYSIQEYPDILGISHHIISHKKYLDIEIVK